MEDHNDGRFDLAGDDDKQEETVLLVCKDLECKALCQLVMEDSHVSLFLGLESILHP